MNITLLRGLSKTSFVQYTHEKAAEFLNSAALKTIFRKFVFIDYRLRPLRVEDGREAGLRPPREGEGVLRIVLRDGRLLVEGRLLIVGCPDLEPVRYDFRDGVKLLSVFLKFFCFGFTPRYRSVFTSLPGALYSLEG